MLNKRSDAAGRLWIVVFSIMLGTVGCSKNQSIRLTADQLQKSFEKSDSSTAREVNQALSAFESSNFTDAIVIMNRVVQNQARIDDRQKKALDDLLVQTRYAVQRNPKLDSRNFTRPCRIF